MALTSTLRAAEPADPAALARTAGERAAAQAAALPSEAVKPGVAVDRDKIRALSEQGKSRGKAALDDLIRRHELQARQLQGAKGLPVRSDAAKNSTPRLTAILSGRVVVALSSSMPEAMAREYIRQLDGIPEGVVILRGFIGGARKVAPTGLWIEKLRRKNPDCRDCPHRQVQTFVDPLTFQMLGIQQVPAVAYLPGVQDLKHCDAEVFEAAEVVYGAVSIKSALERLARDGVAVPAELIQRFGART